MLEGFHRQVEEHGRLRRTVHSRLGLPWPADRNQSGPEAGRQKVADESDRCPAGVSKIRAKVPGSAARPIQTHRGGGPFRQAVLDYDARVRVSRSSDVL